MLDIARDRAAAYRCASRLRSASTIAEEICMPASRDAIPAVKEMHRVIGRGAGSISLTRERLSLIADERRVEVALSTIVSALLPSSIAESRSIRRRSSEVNRARTICVPRRSDFLSNEPSRIERHSKGSGRSSGLYATILSARV